MPDDVVDMIMADHRDVERFVRPLETQPDQRARKFEPDSYNGARMRSGDAEGARALDRRSGFGWTGGWVAAQLPSEVQRAGQTGHEEHKLYGPGPLGSSTFSTTGRVSLGGVDSSLPLEPTATKPRPRRRIGTWAMP